MSSYVGDKNIDQLLIKGLLVYISGLFKIIKRGKNPTFKTNLSLKQRPVGMRLSSKMKF